MRSVTTSGDDDCDQSSSKRLIEPSRSRVRIQPENTSASAKRNRQAWHRFGGCYRAAVEMEAVGGARVAPSRVRALLNEVCGLLDEDLVLLGNYTELRSPCAGRRGLPVPRYQDVVATSQGVVLLQQRLPGRTPERVNAALIDQMLDLNDRFRGLLASRSSLRSPDLYLSASGPGFCLHESLQAYSPTSRALLGWVRRVGAEDGSTATGADLVHLDFHPANVLVDGSEQLTGVIDWDAAGRGDGRLAYTTLLFDLDHGRRFSDRYGDLTDAAVERVRARVDDVEVSHRRMFWAHMSVRQVDWSIRFHSVPRLTTTSSTPFAALTSTVSLEAPHCVAEGATATYLYSTRRKNHHKRPRRGRECPQPDPSLNRGLLLGSVAPTRAIQATHRP